MSSSAHMTQQRRVYTNTSGGAVLYPLGNIRVEVAAGETLVYFTQDAASDPFVRARRRRKLARAVAPTLVVIAILLLAAVAVAMLILKASQGAG